ncbi:MAG: putative disulfide isomerase [Phenylobacterium sp.]|nr:putative disulfide isomerase [Phenylobacterium sp.]
MRRFQVIAMTALLAFSLAACNGAKTAGGALPDDMSQGDPKAKVTVVEYASVGCPVCGRWQKEVYPAFKAKYIDTGKIHYVFREMLVGGGSEVAVASGGFLLARCAGKDKYFSVNDAVFASQPGVFDAPRETLLNVAKSVGMTEAQFNKCVGDEPALLALNKRVEDNAKQGGVDSTPTFVVNGKKLDPGFQPLEVLDAAIAEAQAAK